ncbi:MAG: AAA domain-containing protein, partial [Deltaproteobacteria bacterium]|nr:AAA domain-containing protein [Deltaproteobacteria bacterium]
LHKSYAPMSAAARAVFGRAPTERQIKAVAVAINAPDIAMIQGPPGTGKTSVIAAIQHRLAELDGATEGLRHRVLVTSAQHDAVENVAVRTQVVGLPAMKIGRRRRGDSEGIDSVDVYREEQAGKLRAVLESNGEYVRLREARAHIAAALAHPGTPLENAARLEHLSKIAGDLIPPSLSDRLLDRVRELRRTVPVEEEPRAVARAAVEALRCTRAAFEDDGPKQAAKVLHRCGPWLKAHERALLERCRDWVELEAPQWISDVSEVRDALLDRLTPPVETPSRALDAATNALLHAVVDAVRDGLVQRRTSEEAVLEDLLYDIEHAPGAVRDVLEEYTAVLAATLQQSAAKPMRAVLQTADGSGVQFDTVIVDEAARAHPLDLFIPMGMARRRIVLVGDHRQLPHMLEPEVERALRDGDLPAETERALRDSLFQRLWDLMKAREALDGIARTVMLDEQFRMHPALGDFVSAQFYERKGDQALRSPRGAAEFAHGLAQFRSRHGDAAAAWVDVAAREGQERRGESKSRPAEARRVAELAKRILEADSSLSVGVISFYRAQVNAIADELSRFGVVERDDKGWSIAESYRLGRDRFDRPMERLRVGTVDAFQGKEFDVVLLSVTRSNMLPQRSDAEVRRKYGHLLLDNRLCVAMSRQRRLLVAVGDLDFVRNAERLSALRAFVELCEGEHGVIR